MVSFQQMNPLTLHKFKQESKMLTQKHLYTPCIFFLELLIHSVCKQPWLLPLQWFPATHACSPSDAVIPASLPNLDPFFGLSLCFQYKGLVLTFKATSVSCLGYSRDSISFLSVQVQHSFDQQKSKANNNVIMTRKESLHCIIKCHIPESGKMVWTLQDWEQK